MTVAPRPTIFLLPQAGWKEHVRLPKLKIGPIVAKLDTGARSAALHADEISVSGRRVTFVIITNGRRHTYRAPLAGQKRVKSSNGISEMRAVIRATLEIGKAVFKAEITLTVTDTEVKAAIAQNAAFKGEATLWLMAVEPEVKAVIERGENAGKTVTYHNVVRNMVPAALWKGEAYEGQWMREAVIPANCKLCIAVLQKDKTGQVIGLARA